MGSQRKTRVDEIFNEDNLILIEGLARDGYTNQDIARRLGIEPSVLYNAKRTRPEINEALNRGKEIVDYKVENALLKSALGYRTKEVKITTIMRYGKVVEEQKETLEKDVPPNAVSHTATFGLPGCITENLMYGKGIDLILLLMMKKQQSK